MYEGITPLINMDIQP